MISYLHKLSKALPIVVFLLVCLILTAEQRLSPPSLHTFKKLSAASTATKDEIALLGKMVQHIAELSGDKRQVNIRSTPQADSINVTLVEFSKLSRNSFGLPSEGLAAIGSNVLIFDLNMFRSTLLYTFNESLGVAQAFQPDLSADELLLHSSKMGAVNFELRLKNLAHEGMVNDRYGGKIANAIINDPELINRFARAFTFLIAHELYHLRKRAFGINIDSSQEELRADEFALEVARKILSNTSPGSFQRVSDTQLLFTGFHYFQDKVLAGVFDGFRGLDAASIFPFLIHTTCNEANEVPWPLRFNNPDAIVFGDFKKLPLLTVEEVAILRKRLRKYSSPEHGHILGRVTRILDLVRNSEDQVGMAESLQLSKDLLTLYEGTPLSSHMIWPSLDEVGSGSMSIRNAVAIWKINVERTEISDCSSDDCVFGSMNSGYIEITGRNDKIEYVVLVQPSSKQGLEAVRNVTRTFVGKQKAENLTLRLEKAMADCRLATAIVDAKQYAVMARTINEDGWLEILIEAHPESNVTD